MICFSSISALQEHCLPHREKGHLIGFVPTMGALHTGHISLISKAKSENTLVVCSIFVNPTQFNDPGDLARYPRTPETDAKMLEEAGCDIVFIPEVTEMYPQGYSNNRMIDLGGLDKTMEGRQRPGHFEGVLQIVSRLFDVVKPDKAYFGQKDFQQLAIIREMAHQLQYHVEIIACPIIREPDGLAMSSRNVLLSKEERKLAPEIFSTLNLVKSKCHELSIEELRYLATENIAAIPEMETEYFEIVDSKTLQPLKNLADAEGAVACIAVKLGKVRLIDNIILKINYTETWQGYECKSA